MTHTIPTEQIISERAYEIWQAEGCPQGRALEHWLAAESEFKSMESAPTAGAIGESASKPAMVTTEPADAMPAWNGGIRKSAPDNLGKKRFPLNQGKKATLTRT